MCPHWSHIGALPIIAKSGSVEHARLAAVEAEDHRLGGCDRLRLSADSPRNGRRVRGRVCGPRLGRSDRRRHLAADERSVSELAATAVPVRYAIAYAVRRNGEVVCWGENGLVHFARCTE